MSESAASPYVDQFSCPVCLDPLKEPVTIPCGHSYCMSCITDCWGQKEQGPPYRCPQCRESFSQRPLLKKNTLIAEMMETLQKTSLQTAAVECDVCTTEKNRAVKSCLQCLASFCQTHLQLHYQSPAFMKHKLVEASRNIQENFCLSHGKLLEIYCQDDRQCICCLCTDNHKGHSVVSVDSEWNSKKKELNEIKVSCQKLIQERERGQQELSEAVKLLKSSALETMEDIEKVFTELICSLEKKRSEIKEQIRAQEKTEIDRAEELHKHLDQELTELRKRQAEIDKLLITDDQIQCLKSCQSVCVLPTFEDVPSFTQHTHLSFKDISISVFKEVLEDVCQQQTAQISQEVSNVNVTKPPEPKTPNDFLQYFCELHLDLNTAHRNLKLSEDTLITEAENLFIFEHCKEMSESAASPYVDQFSCPVCLDPLKEPVTIPCGHSYCMSCITDCWGQKEQGPPYRCPQCRESFSQRPLLKKNTLIAEMMETLQKTSLQTAAVECDVCTTEKNRAVKSCLQCLASFCQTHLQLHYQSPAFMKHKLVEASRNIQENFCLSHGKLLEIYCQDDHQCICCLCVTDNHKKHNVVSVDSEWTSKKKELKEIKVSCQKLIQERERGQQELSEAVKSFKSSALESMEDIEKVFTELICSLEKKRSEIKEQIRAQEKTEIDRAEELHKHLDQELTELRKTQAEIDKLLISDHQIQCLKSCQSVCVLPTFEDVPSFTQHTHLSFKDISISAFKEVLEDVYHQQTARISREVSNVHVSESPEPETPNGFLQCYDTRQDDCSSS
ncbi:unnamed protein product [Leuciscus chuanchicus]